MDSLQLPSALLPGDRLPNFMRHDADDKPVVFYDVFCGEPVLLLVALRPDAEPVSRALAEACEIDGATPLVMIEGDPARAAEFRSQLPADPMVLADDGQIMRFLFGGKVPDATLVVFAVDANDHIIERWLDWPGAKAITAAFQRASGASDGRLVSRTAPVLVVPRVFEPEFCRHLIGVYQSDNEPSGVLKLIDGRMVYEADDDTKIRREHRIEEPALKGAVEARLIRRLLPEIQWAYNYKVTRYEAFKVVCYDAATGGYFRAHRDNNSADCAHRRFALTLNLNSEDYAGGELRFPEYGPDRYKPETGGAVVFSCSLAHEALPVSEGTRYALVSFLYGSDTQVRRVEREDRIRGRA